jgi:hypothetical protein
VKRLCVLRLGGGAGGNDIGFYVVASALTRAKSSYYLEDSSILEMERMP